MNSTGITHQRGTSYLACSPERRKNFERITQKSVMGWAVSIFGDILSTKDIYFIQVTINEHTGMIFRPTPALITQK
jgi:hypothetical protein